MPRARFRGRAPAVLEEPDQQENDENQGDNAATDVHTSSSFGCCVNDRGARGVTASHDANHELRAGPDRLALPRGCDLLQRVGLDREVDLAAGGVPHELGVCGATYLRRHGEVRIPVDLQLLAPNHARSERRTGAGRLADLDDARARGRSLGRRDERLSPERVDDDGRTVTSRGLPERSGKVGLVQALMHRPALAVFSAKYYFDHVYDGFVKHVVVKGSEHLLWTRVDAGFIDGAVNGLGTLMRGIARSLRPVQTGFVRHYALLLLAGAVAVVSYLLSSAGRVHL